MDSFTGPVAGTALSPEDLDEVSDEDEAGGYEELTSPTANDAQVSARRSDEDVRETILGPRFQLWFAGLPNKTPQDNSRRDKLKELYSGLKVVDHTSSLESSCRTLLVDFRLGGMIWRYEQRSFADVGSAVWDMAADGLSLEVVPNLAVRLELVDGAGGADDERHTLIGCEHFARPTGAEPERRWADERLLGERLGTDMTQSLGGVRPFLQLLGVVCADPDTPAAYADALPFEFPLGKAAPLLQKAKAAAA